MHALCVVWIILQPDGLSAPTAFLSSSKEAGPGKMGRCDKSEIGCSSPIDRHVRNGCHIHHLACVGAGKTIDYRDDDSWGLHELAPRLQVLGGVEVRPTHVKVLNDRPAAG